MQNLSQSVGLGLAILAVASVAGVGAGCGGASASSGLQPGLYLSEQGQDAIAPLLAITSPEDAEGDKRAFVFRREALAQYSGVEFFRLGTDINEVWLPPTTNGIEGDGPVVGYLAIESDDRGAPTLNISISTKKDGPTSSIKLTYAPVSRHRFAEELMTDERLALAGQVQRIATKDAHPGSDQESLRKFCKKFGWGDKCEALYREVKL